MQDAHSLNATSSMDAGCPWLTLCFWELSAPNSALIVHAAWL
jgi:hypothetical protein